MRTSSRTALATLAVVLLLAGCSANQGTVTAPRSRSAQTSATQVPGALPTQPAEQMGASQIWGMIREYPKWKKAPGFETPKAGNGEHGHDVQVFLNKTAADAVAKKGTTSWPAGSMLVEEGRDAGDGMTIVVMRKKAPNTWIFAQFEADGTPVTSGENKPECVRCHNGGADSVLSLNFER